MASNHQPWCRASWRHCPAVLRAFYTGGNFCVKILLQNLNAAINMTVNRIGISQYMITAKFAAWESMTRGAFSSQQDSSTIFLPVSQSY